MIIVGWWMNVDAGEPSTRSGFLYAMYTRMPAGNPGKASAQHVPRHPLKSKTHLYLHTHRRKRSGTQYISIRAVPPVISYHLVHRARGRTLWLPICDSSGPSSSISATDRSLMGIQTVVDHTQPQSRRHARWHKERLLLQELWNLIALYALFVCVHAAKVLLPLEFMNG